MRTKSTGFTLIEIAVVLVIIGLLAGGILKGQQMIENAKYKAFVKEIDAIRVAVYTFKDKYGYFPGDFPRANTKLSNSNITATNGNGDGTITYGHCTASGEEVCVVWQHLILAGFLSGDPALIGMDSARPTAAGGYFQSVSTGAWSTVKFGILLHMFELPGHYAQRLDDEFDDGKASTGNIACYGGGGAAKCSTSDANDLYLQDKNHWMMMTL